MSDSVRFPLVLGVVCLAAAIGVGGVYTLTKAPIEQRRQDAVNDAKRVVSPANKSTFIPLNSDGTVFKAMDAHGTLQGYVSTGNAQGYGGLVSVLVGFDPNLRISGVAITSQNETPGLGAELGKTRTTQTLWGTFGLDKTEVKSSSWLDRFKDLPGVEAEKVDAQTGATVTSNAIANAVHRAYLRLDQCLKEGNPR